MSTHIPFTDNFDDLSTDRGFQFRFNCERCGNGYISTFKPNAVGMAGDALRAASGLLGGILGRAADSAYDVQRAVGGQQHDGALRDAVEEIRPLFHQCQRCAQWVCQDPCWNGARDQCANCSPKLDHEIAAIESEATIAQLREKSMQMDLTGGVGLNSALNSVKCPSCSAVVAVGAKFCGECGTNMATKPTCGSCGAEAPIGTKFCGECGTRL